MRKLCTLDQNEFIDSFIAGKISVFFLLRLRIHHSHCASCKSEWDLATQLHASLRQVATVAPPPYLRDRLLSQLPEIALPDATRVIGQRKARGSRWVVAGIVTTTILAAGGVTAKIVLDPLRQQYAIMHEDENLSSSLWDTDSPSGITGRLDGLFGSDASTGMRWRVNGRVKVSVYRLQSGDLLASGETGLMKKTESDKIRSLLGPKAYSYLTRFNPVADPRKPPVLTVNANGRVERIIGYGEFSVLDKWHFEIEPLPNEP